MYAEKALMQHQQAKPIRSALRHRPPKPSSRDLVTQWKSQFSIVRELVDNMSPLYIVARDTSSANNVHVVLVPPDEQLQASCFVPQGGAHSSSVPATVGQRRVSQATVRAHVFRGCSLSELTSLAGCSACIVMGGAETAELQQEAPTPTLPTTDTPCNAVLSSCSTSDIACMGTVVVEDLRGNNFEAKILAVGSSGNPFFSFFFIDRPVYEPDSVRNSSRRSVAASVRFSANQPLWQKFPCSAMRLLPLPSLSSNSSATAAASPSKQSDDRSSRSPVDRLGEFLHLYRADEQYFRTILTELANEKDLLAEAGPRLSKDMDRALLFADTEANCFSASYVCVEGFESFMVSKILQIVETSVEIALHEEDDDFNPNGASGHGTSSNAGSEYSSWSDEEREQLAVAFHTTITGSLGLKVVHHWESRFEKEDVALHHACVSLRQKTSIGDMLPNLPGLRSELFDPVAEMLTLLDEDTLSVFTYLRIFETTMNYVVEKIVGFYNRSIGSAKGMEITADDCIPLIVFTLMLAAPSHLFSRLNYILDLSIPPLELSSLGYALTTFEASASQLLEEYRLRLEVS